MMTSLLDAPRRQPTRIALIACGAAALVHGIAAAAATTVRPGDDAHRRTHGVLLSEMIEIEEPPPPEPPPQAEQDEPPPPPTVISKAQPAPKPAPVATPDPPPAAAPAAARAAEVLAHAPEDEVLDFGETVVQGDCAAYAGGVTEAGGTSARAVRDTNARARGRERGTGTDASGVDRSRGASLAGGAVWDCPFPEEADDEGIDAALVTLRVRIDASGALESVDVTRDPGSGFGREARRCARDKRWQPARDRAGNPIASDSAINVRFSR